MYRIYFSWSTWSTIKFHWPSFNETLSPRFLRDCRPRLTSICEVAVADRSTNGIRRRVLNVAATENDVFDGFCSWFAECLTVFRRKWIKSYPYKQRILAHCSPTTSPSSSSVPLPLVYQYWSQEDRGGREGRREREGRGGGGEEKGKEGGGGAKGRGRKRERARCNGSPPPSPPPHSSTYPLRFTEFYRVIPFVVGPDRWSALLDAIDGVGFDFVTEFRQIPYAVRVRPTLPLKPDFTSFYLVLLSLSPRPRPEGDGLPLPRSTSIGQPPPLRPLRRRRVSGWPNGSAGGSDGRRADFTGFFFVCVPIFFPARLGVIEDA